MEVVRVRNSPVRPISGSDYIPYGVRMVLYPDLEFVPVDIDGTPENANQWHFELARTANFINRNTLNGWGSTNPIVTQTITEFTGTPDEVEYQNLGGDNPNTDPLNYKPDYKPGDLLVYCDLEAGKPSIYYADLQDKVATFSPLLVLDKSDNSKAAMFIPVVDTISVDSYNSETGKAKVRISASFTAADSLLPEPRTYALYWESDNDYTPDGDSAITMDLLPGTYTAGVVLRVDSPEYQGGQVWPFAKRTFVFEVYEL